MYVKIERTADVKNCIYIYPRGIVWKDFIRQVIFCPWGFFPVSLFYNLLSTCISDIFSYKTYVLSDLYLVF